jgi:hypothetical protein
LFTEAPIVEVEAEAEGGDAGSAGSSSSGAAPGDLRRSAAR